MLTCRVVVSGLCLAAILAAAASMAAAEKKSATSVATFDPSGQFEHIGIFTAEKKPGERLVTATNVWVTDFQNHPYGVEWLRTDRPFGGPNPHVAYRVDNIEKTEAAAKGLNAFSSR